LRGKSVRVWIVSIPARSMSATMACTCATRKL
jgi:hypothetical protein